jgi:hypothetical protein
MNAPFGVCHASSQSGQSEAENPPHLQLALTSLRIYLRFLDLQLVTAGGNHRWTGYLGSLFIGRITAQTCGSATEVAVIPFLSATQQVNIMKNTMKQLLSTKSIQRGLWMGALLFSAASVLAQPANLSFQVDTSVVGVPGGDSVSVNGNFDGWSGNHILTPSGSVWSGTVANTAVGALQPLEYQFRILLPNGNTDPAAANSGYGYSDFGPGNNYCVILPSSSATYALPYQYFDDDGTPTTYNIKFQVDMAEQANLGNFVPATDAVYGNGSFEGWANNTWQLFPDTSAFVTNSGNIVSMPYTNTYTTWSISPGAEGTLQYTLNHDSTITWESVTETFAYGTGSGNRPILNAAGTLPLVNFSDVPYTPPVTETFNFQVDMSVQIALGNLDPNSCTVTVAGTMNGYNTTGPAMTPLPSPNQNIYTYSYTLTGAPSYQAAQFKYVIEAGCLGNGVNWENPSAANQFQSDGNRYVNFPATSGTVTIPTVYYSDDSLADVTTTPCLVTFTVDTTPILPGGPLAANINGGSGFILGFDWVSFNGITGGVDGSWSAWNDAAEMTEIGSGPLYTITVPVNAGQPVDLVYKYGVDGQDDEAGVNDNHDRYIRIISNTGSGYIMPTDLFGNNQNGSTYEPSMGNLAISQAAGGNVQLAWLGRPAVQLEKTSSLTPPITWTTLPSTDGAVLTVTQGNQLQGVVAGGALGTNVSTTFSTGSAQQYYRLFSPQ